jgi:transposase InsO family protein
MPILSSLSISPSCSQSRKLTLWVFCPGRQEGSNFYLWLSTCSPRWMEAMPVVNITQDAAVKFLHSIIFKFSIPKWVLTDNGTQFKGPKFARCHSDFGINHQVSSSVHTQTNGKVERENRLILQGMKIRMFNDLEAKGKN